MSLNKTERELRLFVYQYFAKKAKAPDLDAMARAQNLSIEAVTMALQNLADYHAIALEPNTLEIWMAHPFSAVPTPYRVETDQCSYWANCAWDVFGIAALLQSDVSCSCRCPDCGDQLEFGVENDRPYPLDHVIHFAVPPRRFWEDVGYT